MTLYTEIRTETELDYKDIAQVMYDIGHGSKDFTIDDYRFIRKGDIDDILCDELKAEPHHIGTYNSYFLAEILGISVTTIDTLQELALFELIGDIVIDQGKIEDFVSSYIKKNVYSAHFASCACDHEDQIIHDYYMFKI